MTIRIDGTNTSANPGVTGADADTGLQFGTNEVKIVTGGTDRVTVDSSGRLLHNTNATGTANIIIDSQLGNGSALRLIGKSANDGSEIDFFADNNSTRLGYLEFNNAVTKLVSETAVPLSLHTSGTERLRVDSSGRLLVGTTTSDNAVSYADNLVIGTTSGDNGMTIVSGTSDAGSINFSDGSGANETKGIIQYHHSSDNLTFYVNSSERLRIDSSGNVGIGESTPDSKLDILYAAGTDSATQKLIHLRTDGSSSYASRGLFVKIGRDGAFDNSAAHYDIVGSAGNSGTHIFKIQGTERMRITASGRLFHYGNQDCLQITSNAAAGTTYALIDVSFGGSGLNSGSTSFKVFSNGNVQNTNNSYGALSDIKLKENIVNANSQWEDLKAIQIRNYNFIEGQTHTQIGVVAQEVETVSPGLVTESPDRDEDNNDLGTVTKSVNYSVLYMKAVKALQEAMTRIETLETQNASLEARLTTLEGGAS